MQCETDIIGVKAPHASLDTNGACFSITSMLKQAKRNTEFHAMQVKEPNTKVIFNWKITIFGLGSAYPQGLSNTHHVSH